MLCTNLACGHSHRAAWTTQPENQREREAPVALFFEHRVHTEHRGAPMQHCLAYLKPARASGTLYLLLTVLLLESVLTYLKPARASGTRSRKLARPRWLAQ